MRILLCSTRCTVGDLADEIGALIRLDVQLATRLLALRERYALDDDLDVSQIVLHDSTPDLWERDHFNEAEELETLLEAGEWTEWSAYLGDPPAPSEDLRTETDELVLTRSGVWWQFEVKHSEVRRETCILSWTDIERAAAG